MRLDDKAKMEPLNRKAAYRDSARPAQVPMALFPCFPEEKEKFLKSIKCQAGQTGGMKEEAMEKLLCPSMMCADFGALKREMEALEKAGIEEGNTVRMYGFDFDYYK